jgi:hypothetical protein
MLMMSESGRKADGQHLSGNLNTGSLVAGSRHLPCKSHTFALALFINVQTE